MTQPNWTPEQWYQWARIQAEIEYHWMEMQRLQQRRADREMRNYSHREMTDADKRRSARTGLMDLVMAPVVLVYWLFRR